MLLSIIGVARVSKQRKTRDLASSIQIKGIVKKRFRIQIVKQSQNKIPTFFNTFPLYVIAIFN